MLCVTVFGLVALPLSDNTATADPTDCVCGIFGDLNCDGGLNPVDIVYIVQLVYKNQDARCEPEILDCPILLGDVNCDDAINPLDVIYYARVIYGNRDVFCANPCPPTGESTGYSSCKSYSTNSVPPEATGKLDCIEWSYDGVSTLNITHLNGCFNCMPMVLDLQVSVTSGLITIEEGGYGFAYCLCLRDFEYQVDNLPPGTYMIYVVGNCHEESPEKHLRVTVDLVASPSGSYCIERNEYPW